MKNETENKVSRHQTIYLISQYSIDMCYKTVFLRSFKSNKHFNEKRDGPYRGFGCYSLFSDPIDLETWNHTYSHLGFWSGNLSLIAPFPDHCILVPSYSVILQLSTGKSIQRQVLSRQNQIDTRWLKMTHIF